MYQPVESLVVSAYISQHSLVVTVFRLKREGGSHPWSCCAARSHLSLQPPHGARPRVPLLEVRKLVLSTLRAKGRAQAQAVVLPQAHLLLHLTQLRGCSVWINTELMFPVWGPLCDLCSRVRDAVVSVLEWLGL